MKKEDLYLAAVLISVLVVIIATFVFVLITNNQAKAIEICNEDFTDLQLHDTPAPEKPKVEEVKKPKIINEGYTQTLTKSSGVNYYNGLRETYYSSNVMPHYRMSEWWVDENGFYRTQEGYFVVAYTMTAPIGSIINISMGQAMVCDHCPTSNTIDIYVN